MEITKIVKDKLEKSLEGSKVEVIDHSHEHIEHNNTGANLEVIITYKGFDGKALVERHKMVFDVLKEEMKEKIR